MINMMNKNNQSTSNTFPNRTSTGKVSSRKNIDSLVIAVKKTSRRDRPPLAHRFIGGTRDHAIHRVPEGRSSLGKTGGGRPSGTKTPESCPQE